MRIAIGSDHGGFELKEELKKVLQEHAVPFDDVGCHSLTSADYPDYAAEVARRILTGVCSRGVLICTTGNGMAITANKYPGIRAALCLTVKMAEMSRAHNDANVLVFGAAEVTVPLAREMLATWLKTEFADNGRHSRRIGKIGISEVEAGLTKLLTQDPAAGQAILREGHRQSENLELIASENYTSRAVREAQGSVLTNKYAEGYPGKRYYNGCEFVDEIEQMAIDRAKQLFGAEHANVQPHCGSSANMAVYFSVLNPGDRIMAMSLAHGGHLTHGHPVNFSGRFFEIIPYGVHPQTEVIDYDELERMAAEHKPKLLCAGASAYSRVLDFPRLKAIADSVGAMLMVDMAHIAGLVAAEIHPSPVPYCDFVTSTTHKTLRGPRGGLILCKEQHAAAINKTIFPGIQGGPLEHVIAAKAVCFEEARQPAFKEYARQVVRNAKVMADELVKGGLRIVSGGTDNHLMLVDLTPVGVTGKDAATALDRASITVNKNAIPFDQQKPAVTSGIRVGTPAITTRGMQEPEMALIAGLISDVLRDAANEQTLATVREKVLALTARFPVP